MKNLALIICILSFVSVKSQDTQALIGAGGAINTQMKASPFLSFRHFFFKNTKGLGAEIRYSQYYFEDHPDAYNVQTSVLYGFSRKVSSFDLYINAGFFGAVDLNQALKEKNRNPYLGTKLSSGFVFQEFVIDVSYQLAFKEGNYWNFTPFRSSLSIGLGFRL